MKKQLIITSLLYLFAGLVSNLTSVALPLFYLSKGYSAEQIAFLFSITFLGAIFQPLIGSFTDHVKHPKTTLQICAILTTVFATSMFFTHSYLLMVILSIFLAIFRSSVFGILDGIATSLSLKHLWNFGLVRTGGSLGFGLGLLVSLPFLLVFGVDYLVLVVAVLSLFSFILLFPFNDLDAHTKSKEKHDYMGELKNLSKSKVFIYMILLNIFFASTTSVRFAYTNIVLQNHQVSLIIISLISLFAVVFEVIFMAKCNDLINKFKFSSIMTVLIAIALTQNIIYALFPVPIVLGLFACLHGITMAAYLPSWLRVFRNSIGEHVISTAFMISGTLSSIVFFIITALIIGPVAEKFGPEAVFYVTSIATSLAFIFNWRLKKNGY